MIAYIFEFFSELFSRQLLRFAEFLLNGEALLRRVRRLHTALEFFHGSLLRADMLLGKDLHVLGALQLDFRPVILLLHPFALLLQALPLIGCVGILDRTVQMLFPDGEDFLLHLPRGLLLVLLVPVAYGLLFLRRGGITDFLLERYGSLLLF